MNRRKIQCFAAAALAAVLAFGAAEFPALANSAPTVQNQELETYRGVSVGGRLSAVDPDGDTVIYRVTTQPVKGAVELKENGEFVYTPADGKKGKDYFGYKASDMNGNTSQEGTVIVTISRKKAAVTYSDMAGSGEYLDAVTLAQEGIFTGEKVGDTWLYEPERSVSRGEFLSMCMELADTRLLSGVLSTGFLDDTDIPGWEKPYVATAVMNGTVCGYSAAGGANFDSSKPVTMAEAAVMLSSAVGFENVAVADTGSSVPGWAAQSVANLASHSIPTDGAVSSAVTRAQAARMLVKALNALKAK
jgi:hypothetical protein